jgi:hypothetical protein
MSRNQNARRSYYIKFDSSFVQRMEEFKYLGTNIKNQNSFQEKIKSVSEIKKYFLSFGAESFVFQFSI